MTTKILSLLPFGDVVFSLPRSYAARMDLVQAYLQQEKDWPKLGRVYAAAVGLCWTQQRAPLPALEDGSASRDTRPPLPELPLYLVDEGRVLLYGAVLLDHLVGLHNVPPEQDALWGAGKALCEWVRTTLPSAERIEKKPDSTSPKEAA